MITKTKRAQLLIGIVLGVLTYWLFAQSFLNIAPTVQVDLGLSNGIITTGVSITALMSGIFIVGAGGLADSVGRVKITMTGLVLNIVGSLLLIVTAGPALFILGRILQGFSAACIMPATMALVKTYYEGKDRQRALSYWSLGSWGGTGFSSFFGGAIASTIGWRYIFVISIMLSIVALFLVKGTPESKVSKASTNRFDYLGLVIFVISMLAINLFISNGASMGWLSGAALALAAVGVVGLVVFFKVEHRDTDTFIDFSLFENRTFLGATISNFLLNAVAGAIIVINSYVQEGRGLSAASTGVLSIGYLVVVLFAIPVGERLLQQLGAKTPMLIGAIITAFGISLMSLTMFTGVTYFVFVALGYSLYGLGLGMYATPSTDAALSTIPNEKAGVASGIYKMASSLGGAIGVALSVAAYNGVSAGGNYILGQHAGLGINILFCAITVISVMVFIPKTTKEWVSE